MKKIFFFFVVAVFFSLVLNSNLFAQDMDISYDQIHASRDKPMPYQYIRDADVMWSKIIWRRIELNEKTNQILALPKEPAGNRMSLIDVIMNGIHNQGLVAYNAKPQDAGNEFDVTMSEEEVIDKMEAVNQWEYVCCDSVHIYESYKSWEIKSYLIKEIWYYDKQRSVLEVRILGVCPILTYYSESDVDQLNPLYRKIFWVSYPEIRPLLAKSPVYNPNTDVANLTYDDIFQKRYFSSYIFMEANPYKRALGCYETGLDILFESNRITKKIFDMEQGIFGD